MINVLRLNLFKAYRLLYVLPTLTIQKLCMLITLFVLYGSQNKR